MTAEREMTEKQRRIVEAAMDVFAERGFAAASTSEIAKRAGVAEGTIFKHYKTKKDLLIGVVAPFFFRFVAPHLLDEIVALFRAEYPSFEAFLRAIYRNRLEFVRSHARAIRIALQEVPFHPEVREMAAQTVVAKVYPEARALIQKFQKRGELRKGDPASILRIIGTTMLGYIAAREVLAPQRDWDDDAELDFMIAVLAQGLAPPRSQVDTAARR